MKHLPLVSTLLTLTLLHSAPAEIVSLPGHLSLPEGWTLKPEKGIDSNPGSIVRGRDNLTIKYDIGMLAGISIKPEDKANYSWYVEQTIHAHPVRMAITKNAKDEQTLHVTFVDATANFWAVIKTPADVAEVLAVLLSFDYTIPPGKEGKMKAGVTDSLPAK